MVATIKNQVFCLDCDHSIQINPRSKPGHVIVCPNCKAELEIISLNPPEIDFYYQSLNSHVYESSDAWEEDHN